MSDTFREQLVTRYRAATLRVTKDELHEVMKEYDRLAPERERERRALQVFEEAQFAMQTLMAKGGGCAVCPLETECFEPEYVRCLATDFVAAARRLDILPAEEAQP